MPSRDVFRGPSGPATPSVADGGGGGGVPAQARPSFSTAASCYKAVSQPIAFMCGVW